MLWMRRNVSGFPIEMKNSSKIMLSDLRNFTGRVGISDALDSCEYEIREFLRSVKRAMVGASRDLEQADLSFKYADAAPSELDKKREKESEELFAASAAAIKTLLKQALGIRVRTSALARPEQWTTGEDIGRLMQESREESLQPPCEYCLSTF